MVNMKQLKKGKIILIPYPAQGHVSPMQKLALAFVRLGFEAVIVVPQYIHRQIMIKNDDDDDNEIKWVGLEDGLGQNVEEKSPDFFGIESAMENRMPSELEEVVDGDVACMVVDLLASWAIEVGQRCGIPIAGFWPAMFASYRLIAAIPHLLRRRIISDTGLPEEEEEEGKIWLEPIISTEDLPWLIGTVAARKGRFKFWKRTMERCTTLKWVLVNSFPGETKLIDDDDDDDDDEFSSNINSESHDPRVLPIGPMNELTKSVSFWEEDLSCLKWLSTQKPNSVVYISFGSWVSPIGEPKLKTLALALEALERPFIWVLRSTWRQGLPVGFLERVVKEGIGRVVSWAPQTQILQHDSVACYVTHCGWNSILEALEFQKKLLCYPVAGDQFVNCAYVVQIWRVGLKLNGLGLKDVEEGVSRVMEDKEMSNRLRKLHERIMGHNKRVPFMLKTFLQDLTNNKPSFTLLSLVEEILKRFLNGKAS